MPTINRSVFLRMLMFMGISALGGCKRFTPDQLMTPSRQRTLQGDNLAGWEISLGDANYTCPDEPAVGLADIETIDEAGYSELRANINHRAIMAHNITFKRQIDDMALKVKHICGYHFRLPQVPQPNVDAEFNAQTVEGGLFIWDGHQTRLDYGVAFQWSLNPWDAFGDLRTWTGSRWVKVGYIAPDTQWHEVRITVEPQEQTGTMQIDGVNYSTSLSQTRKPDNWGSEIAARLQVEIVSIYPGTSCMKATHRAKVRDWLWIWEYEEG